MKIVTFAILIMVLLAEDALACSPPYFPALEAGQDEVVYEQDKARFFELGEKLFPCPMYGTPEALSDEERSALQQDYDDLKAEYFPADPAGDALSSDAKSEAQTDAGTPAFYDVPEDEFVIWE